MGSTDTQKKGPRMTTLMNSEANGEQGGAQWGPSIILFPSGGKHCNQLCLHGLEPGDPRGFQSQREEDTCFCKAPCATGKGPGMEGRGPCGGGSGWHERHL